MSSGAIHHIHAGRSIEGRELVAHTNFDPTQPAPPNVTLLLGGTHGNEPASYELVAEFCADFLKPEKRPARSSPSRFSTPTPCCATPATMPAAWT
jgi:hypothetical protein